MNGMEELGLYFKSGNSIPVERAWVKKEVFDAAKSDFDQVLHQRNLLGQAIADAAVKMGICNGEVPLDGPQLLLLMEDIAKHFTCMESFYVSSLRD